MKGIRETRAKSQILKPRESGGDSRCVEQEEHREKISMAYCVSLPQCSKGLNMTPLHPDPVLQEKSKREREREKERECLVVTRLDPASSS